MTAYDTQVLALNPDGYWKLNETSGLVFADSSGHAHSLTAGAGAVENYAIPGPSPSDIPVACDFLNVNPPALGVGTVGQFGVGQAFSVECWLGSVGAVPANLGLVTKGYNVVEQRPWWSLGFTTGGIPQFWFRNVAGLDFKLVGYGNVSDATYTQRGPWHHLVGTYTPGTADLYVDGVHQVQLGVPNTGWGTGAQPMTLGVLAAAVWGGPWLADVAVYHSQLNSIQVQSNFEVGLTNSPQTINQLGLDLSSCNAKLDAILAAVQKTFPTTS